MSTATISRRLSQRHPGPQERHHTRALAVLGGLTATMAIWLVADPLAGVDLALRSAAGSDVHQVGPASVALTTLLAGLAAWGLLATLEHIAPRPRTAFLMIASATLLLSLAGPVSLGQTNAVIATLVSMHVAAAGVLIPSLARSTPARTRTATPNPHN